MSSEQYYDHVEQQSIWQLQNAIPQFQQQNVDTRDMQLEYYKLQSDRRENRNEVMRTLHVHLMLQHATGRRGCLSRIKC